MKKKLTIILGVVWAVVIVLGATEMVLKKSSEKINIIETVDKKREDEKEENLEEARIYILENGKLVEKEVEIPYSMRTRDKIRSVAELVFKNLEENKLLKSKDVEIRNIYITEDMAYLDMDSKIMDLQPSNKTNLLAIYSLVNSITEMTNIKRVKILVDGKEEGGSFSKVYTRNTSI